MSTQKYTRTNFEEDRTGAMSTQVTEQDSLPLETSSINGNPVSPGVTYSTTSSHCWARRTLFEKVFMVAICICAVLILFLVILDISTFRRGQFSKQYQPPPPMSAHCTLDGVWYNQLGSEIILHLSDNGRIAGEYRTAVERQNGTAGNPHSIIVGAAPYQPGSVFAFSVMWNDGASTTAWTGQCVTCDGKPVLMTSWLLRSKVDTCLDKWKSTLIGQDTFTRHEQNPGPRKKLETNQSVEKTNGARKRSERTSDTGKSDGSSCHLEGTWYSEVGSEMILSPVKGSGVSGEYRTAVEREKGSAGHTHSSVYGIANVQDPNSTLALFVVWKQGQSVTGWVGQCHICDNDTQVLETTWLLRQQVASCDQNWQSTFHGQSSFTRHPIKQGPRKSLGVHTPRQLGEDEDDLVANSSSTMSNPRELIQLYSLVALLLLIRR